MNKRRIVTGERPYRAKRSRPMSYRIQVIWNDGTVDWLYEKRKIAEFPNQKKAEEWRDFMLEGISDEVQSINVVKVNR